MWINDVCCLRSSEQSNTECTEMSSTNSGLITDSSLCMVN